MTISFWARVQGLTGGGLSNLNRLPIAVECAQYLGGKTGEYYHSDVLKMKRGATGAKSHPNGVDHNTIVKRADMNITTSWAKYSTTFTMPNLAGMTLGLDNDELKSTDNPFKINMMNKPGHYTSIKIVAPGSTFDIQDGIPLFGATASSTNQGATISYELNLALVQAEQDDGASEFEYRGPGEELRLASRYYQRVFYGDNHPGGVAVGSVGSTCLFPVRMRVCPLPVRKINMGVSFTGNPEAGGTNDTYYGGTQVNEYGFMPSQQNSTGDGSFYAIMDFDAEIANWSSHRHVSKTLTNPGAGTDAFSARSGVTFTTLWQKSNSDYFSINKS